MNKIVSIVTSRPKSTLLIAFIITAVMVFGMTKLKTRTDFESELPGDDPVVQTDNRFKSIFGDKDVLLIAIETDDIFNTRTLDKVAAISEALKGVDGVIEDEINSLSTVNNIKGEEWGVDIGPFMKTVPATQAGLNTLRNQVRSNNTVYGRMVSKDETTTLVTANLIKGYDLPKVYLKIKEIASRFEGPERIYLAGDPIAQQEASVGIQSDIGALFPIALLMVLLGFFISFRTLRGVFLPLLVVALSVIWTLGVMGFVGLPMTMVSSTLPVLMIAIASSYGIHLLHRYYEESADKDREVAVKTATSKIGWPILITGITSALGSATLIVFQVTSIREFGVIAAVGVVMTTLITLLVLPALLSILKQKARKRPSRGVGVLDRVIVATVTGAMKHKLAVSLGAVALVIVSSVGISQIKVGNDFIETFPPQHPLRTAFEELNAKLGGARYVNIMVEGSGPGAIKDPGLMGRIDDLQKFIESHEEVGYVSSISDILTRMNRVINADDPLMEKIPESRDLIAQYLLLYSMSGDPGDFADRIDYDYRRAKLQVMLKTSDQELHKQLYKEFDNYAQAHLKAGEKAEFGGEVMFWSAVVDYIVKGKILNILAAVTIVWLLCSLIYRSAIGGLFSIVPLAVCTLLTFGIMGFAGIRLEMGTAIITSFAVGIGVDFAIHYLSRVREESKKVPNIEQAAITAAGTSGKAIVYDVMSNVLGFSVFVFSGFVPIQYFGWLISLTMITVAIGTLVLLPMMLSLVRPAFITNCNKVDMDNAIPNAAT